MAVNFKKLISYSIDNKYEKIYNYLKINKHLEITKDDIDKIMELDFDIKFKIKFIEKIKENIYAVIINADAMKYFICMVNDELLKSELAKDTMWSYNNFLNFLYIENINYLKTSDLDSDYVFIASMHLLQKEVNKQIPGYNEIDNIVDIIHRLRIADFYRPEISNDNEACDKWINILPYLIPSPLNVITTMKYDSKLNYLCKRIIELDKDDVNKRDSRGYTFLHNYLQNWRLEYLDRFEELLEVAVKKGFNVNEEPTLLTNSLDLSLSEFFCVYDILKNFDYDLINDKSSFFTCDDHFSEFYEVDPFYKFKDIYLIMVIKFLILELESNSYKINPNLGKKICKFDKQLYDILEHLNVVYDEEYLANELYEIIVKNRNESLCVVNEEVDVEEVLYALKELLNNVFNSVNNNFDEILTVNSLVKKIDSK